MSKKRRKASLNLRPGVGITLLPGLRLYLSIGKTGLNFHVFGKPKAILKSLTEEVTSGD